VQLSNFEQQSHESEQPTTGILRAEDPLPSEMEHAVHPPNQRRTRDR